MPCKQLTIQLNTICQATVYFKNGKNQAIRKTSYHIKDICSNLADLKILVFMASIHIQYNIQQIFMQPVPMEVKGAMYCWLSLLHATFPNGSTNVHKKWTNIEYSLNSKAFPPPKFAIGNPLIN